jgi:DNA-binding SARP family transcriptional activator
MGSKSGDTVNHGTLGRACVEFRILGPLEVLDEGRVIPLPGGRARALLALLALRVGQVVSADRLIDELWGDDPPPTAHTALQGLVSSLRKRLEPARRAGEAPSILRTAGSGYLLDVDPGLVDALHFKALLEQSRGEPIEKRAITLREALSLWHGPALVDVTFEAVGEREIAALEDLRLEALEERVEADLARGLAGALTTELEQLVAEHPVRERLRAQLMLALYRSGRQAEALEAYRDGREVLVEELGIEPGPGLRHLEQAILRQDVALDVQPSPETAAAGRTVTDRGTTDAPWLAGERKAVTVLSVGCSVSVADDDGHDGLDVEAQHQTAVRVLDVASDILRRHGARVEELVGDELVALFGLPVAHEDDALRAVRAAIELRESMTALANEVARDRGERLGFRAGMETGEVVVSPPDVARVRIFGVPIQRAARLQRGAPDGQVVIGEGTSWLVRGAATLEPLNESTVGDGVGATWRLLDVQAWASEGGRIGSPFVGRRGELARVRDAFDRSVARGSPYRLCVLGEPGIGKSRLAGELTMSIGRQALVLTGHCPAYGEGISFWPLREIVQATVGPRGPGGLADIVRAEDDGEWIAAQVSAGTGLTSAPARADQLFPAVRRLLEALAARRPVVVVLEDLHWAQPTFLDLVEYLGEWARGPLLLLGLARPELLEDRPMWGLGGEAADTLFLEPFDRAESERLIANLGPGFDPFVRSQIVETARGNPLFVEQLVASTEEDGLRSVTTVPPSLGALLAARLDRLGRAERDILRSAAVVGTDFSIAAVAALIPESARPRLEPNLAELARKQLIAAGSTTTAFRFRHVLVQLAAYGNTTRADRARLHQRYADWLEREDTEQPAELDEILGYHLEQAVKHRRALGSPDDSDGSRAVRAGEHLARAGSGAFRRLDVTAAENLLSRALALLPADHADQRRIKPTLSEARQILGRHEEADAVLADLQQDAAVNSDEILGRRIRVERARIQLITGPDPIPLDVIFEEAAAALQYFTTSGDDVGAAQACYVLVLGNLRRGLIPEMERVARLSFVHAGRSGSMREEAASRWMVALALNLGPSAVRDAIAECEELARWHEAEHPGVLCELAHLRAMLGEFGEARELIARARRLMVEWMRARRPLMFAAQSSAAVELLAGELGTAEQELRIALQMAMDMKEREVASDCAARLARLLSGLDRLDQADAFATMSADRSPSEHVVTQALWRAARAVVVARVGDRDTALGLAREALTLAPAEMLNLQADLLTNLADIQRAGRDGAGASASQREAIGLYRRKGNLVAAAHAAMLPAMGSFPGGVSSAE